VSVMAPEPLPECPGEAIPVEADFTGGYDEETGEYQIGLGVPGLRIIVNVHPDAFEAVDTVLAVLPHAVAEIIEQIEETRDSIQNTEEPPHG
jgi:hypothetical protein